MVLSISTGKSIRVSLMISDNLEDMITQERFRNLQHSSGTTIQEGHGQRSISLLSLQEERFMLK